MGNKQCNCLSSSSSSTSGDIKKSKKRRDISLSSSHKDGYNSINADPNNLNATKLQHISDREQIDGKFIAFTVSVIRFSLKCKFFVSHCHKSHTFLNMKVSRFLYTSSNFHNYPVVESLQSYHFLFVVFTVAIFF